MQAASVEGAVSAISYSVSPDFFTSVNLRLLRGRDFTGGRSVQRRALPSRSSTKRWRGRFSATEDPIGRQLQINLRDETEELVEIVGIAPPILHQMNDPGPGPQMYRPLAQDFRAGVTIHLTTSAASAEAEALMLPGVRQLLRAVDDRLPVVTLETRPMFRERNLMLWVVRAGAWVFTAFGFVALAHGRARHLRCEGLPRVAAHARDRHPHGARREPAPGRAAGDERRPRAHRRRVWWRASDSRLLMSPAVGSLLFQGAGFDAPVVALAFLTLLAAASLASWLPARRATRIAPSSAVRDLSGSGARVRSTHAAASSPPH